MGEIISLVKANKQGKVSGSTTDKANTKAKKGNKINNI